MLVADLLAFRMATAACSKPLNRRFIVVEGIYANYGDVAPLDRIKELKEVREKDLSEFHNALARAFQAAQRTGSI